MLSSLQLWVQITPSILKLSFSLFILFQQWKRSLMRWGISYILEQVKKLKGSLNQSNCSVESMRAVTWGDGQKESWDLAANFGSTPDTWHLSTNTFIRRSVPRLLGRISIELTERNPWCKFVLHTSSELGLCEKWGVVIEMDPVSL